jgi:hypothetical protein
MHLLGAADADVVGDERLEEAARPARVVEDHRGGHFDLAHRQLPQYPPARSAAVNGVGTAVIQRSKKACTSAGPNRSQIACNASGSAQVANPLANAV